jgi:zinc transport system ATP-binding protein
LNKHLHFHGDKEEFEKLDEHELSSLYHFNVRVLSHDHEKEGV